MSMPCSSCTFMVIPDTDDARCRSFHNGPHAKTTPILSQMDLLQTIRDNPQNLLPLSIKLCQWQLFTMTVLASLAQITLRRIFTFAWISWLIHLYTTPLFQTVSHSFFIRVIRTRFTKSIASLTTLVINPRVVLRSVVHPYSDSNLLAWPSVWNTCWVTAYEPTHYDSVVRLGARSGIIVFMEVEI